MTTALSLPYGSRTLSLRCRGDVHWYAVDDPLPDVDADRFARRLCDFFEGSDPDLSRPAVVVADKTRLCGYGEYLPVLFDVLGDHGADLDALSIYIAYGTHMRQRDADSRAAYGAAYGRHRWVHHRCEGDHFVRVGVTPQGTPVHLRKDIVDASFVITFGAISHHYFAGYGGGRKLIFPGLGRKDAIYANHGLFLDKANRRLTPGCRPGRLEGNPLARDLADYEAFCPADLAIHGILNSRGEVCDVLVGQGSGHFQNACRQHAAHCEVAAQRSYDLVIGSCGGFPKDINFIQSHKAIHNAAEFVRDGGRLVILAECRDGVGSETFLPWFELGSRDAAFDRLSAEYMGNGGTALAMMAKSRRIRISLVSDLDPGVADLIGVALISPEAVQDCLDGHDGSVAVIPHAGMVVRRD